MWCMYIWCTDCVVLTNDKMRQWLHSFSKVRSYKSRFVRLDRSSPVKKNAQIFLVVVCGVILFSSAPNLHRAPQTTPSFISKQTMPAPGSTDGRGCQIFLKCIGADQIWLRTWSVFARMDLDRSRFVRFWEECNHSSHDVAVPPFRY